MASHTILVERGTVHGPFNRERQPILTVNSGDTVIFRTLDAGWGTGPDRTGDQGRGFEREPADEGHALTGPVAVRGARPGDVLEIEIGEMRPAPWGWTWAGPPRGNRYDLGLEGETVLPWQIDLDSRTASNADLGVTVAIHPFMGVMGNAPSVPGLHPTSPPRRVGGNLDCRELISGSTLWLPVEIEGALFSVGDGHAAQGDGEASSTAIECPMERVELRFHVRKDMAIDAPRARTPAGYITFGLGPTLDDAARMAISEMLDYLQETYSFDRPAALALTSVVVDLRVTQVVNGTLGVHAILAPNAFSRT